MLPENIYLSEDSKEQKRELINSYRDIASEINGFYKEYVPTINNCTVTAISALSYRKGLMVDFWINFTWSAVTGNIEIELPYKSKVISNSVWYSPLTFSEVTLSAGYTGISIGIPSDSRTATIYEFGSANAIQALTASSGTIIGNIRYVGQQDQ